MINLPQILKIMLLAFPLVFISKAILFKIGSICQEIKGGQIIMK